MNADPRDWKAYSEAFAFLGNSLLAPMNQIEAYGIDPAFWQSFPNFGSREVEEALSRCESHAISLKAEDPIQQISVEYTQLFVGPPRPAAAPWETFYRAPEGTEVTVGFGTATFEMQQLLREAGLRVQNENNQYADHMGIELLYLSILCGRASDGGEEAQQTCAAFANAHPLAWIEKFEQRVDEACPEGYYRNLIHLAKTLLRAL